MATTWKNKELKDIIEHLDIRGTSGKNKEEIIEILKKEKIFVPRNGLMTGEEMIADKNLQPLLNLSTYGISPEPKSFGITFIVGSYSGVIFGRNKKYKIMWTRNRLGIWIRPHSGNFISASELYEETKRAWFL